MNILRACLDWRVLGGVALFGLAVYLLAPGLILAVLPVLLVAVCPLSMLLMMRSMRGQPADAHVLPRSAGGDREAALRGELAELVRREEQLTAELRELGAGEPLRWHQRVRGIATARGPMTGPKTPTTA